ncbi:MAG TPA: hypothetical protein VF582_00080 [Allosphingosinicella sp.]|jgi:hypothetical protein
MPRFFFHVYDDEVALDDEGLDLPDLDTVRAHAVVGARSLICEVVSKGHINLRHRIEVEDEDRRPVLTLPFASAVAIEA